MRIRALVSLVTLVALMCVPAANRLVQAALPPTPTLVGAVDFVDGQVGWVETSRSAQYIDPRCVGSQSNTARCSQAEITVDATHDGGRSWRAVLRLRARAPLQSADGLPATAIHLFDHSRGYVALSDPTGHAVQFWTYDAGARWTRRPLPVAQALVNNADLSFPTLSDGYLLVHREGAMAQEAVDVYATHDGGARWHRVESARFTGRSTPYAVGLPGDKGAMFFLNRFTGWISSSDPTGIPYLYGTEDRSATWGRETLPVPRGVPTQAGGRSITGSGELQLPTFFSQVSGLLPETLLLCTTTAASNRCSFSLYAYRLVDNGRRWGAPVLLRRAPNQRFQPRWQFLGPNRWLVSFGNSLWSTSNAGGRWRLTHASLPGGLVLDELSLLGPSGGWAIATHPNPEGSPTSARLLRTSDGGRDWAPVQLP